MKKPLLYSIVCGAALAISSALTLTIGFVSSTTNDHINNNQLVAINTNLGEETPTSFSSRDETVYIITDHTGEQTKSFVNNTLNSSSEPIPVTVQIKYWLDGTEIDAKSLAGKSGRVKITYSFSSVKSYQNKLVPFLTITGLTFDQNKFTNIKIDNGKIVAETADSIILAGYAFAGLNEDLSTNLISNSFTVEADTTDFTLGTVYSFATSELIADIDTSKLTSIDSLINSVNELSAGLDRIISGSQDLASGLDSALNGSKTLMNGIKELNSGAHTLANGATSLSAGANKLATNLGTLSSGLDQLSGFSSSMINQIDATTASIEGEINAFKGNYAETIETLAEDYPELTSDLSEITTKITNYYNQVRTTVGGSISNIDLLANGAKQASAGANSLATNLSSLSDGINSLANGADKLESGAGSLVDGLSKLSSGSHTLKDGLTTFKSTGIDKLVNFANHDLDGFLRNLRSTVSSARSYRYYSNKNAHSVKFIFKTPEIK